MSRRPLSDAQLEEVSNLAAESELDHETALARAYELLLLRKLHEACLRRHGYIALGRLPSTVGDSAWFKQRIRDSLREPGQDDDAGAPDLVSLAAKQL